MLTKLKKILLVYPKIPTNTYWSFKYALKFIKKKSAMPPLGLITVAAYLPDNIELKLIDMNIESLTDTDIKWADSVFISAMVVQQKSFEEVVMRCNSFNKKIVAGGPYVTVNHEKITGVDHMLLGEVEHMFESFLDEFEQGTAKAVYPITTRPDITHTRTPRFDLLNIKAYGSMAVQYSRGCPFNCEFCDIWQTYGRTPRLKSSKDMLAELEVLYKLGWTGAVFVVDDNFIGNKRQVKEDLLPALIKWHKEHKHVFRFYTEASLNLAEDEKLLSLMRDAGFNSVFLGIETPSVESLQETGKFQNVKSSMPAAIAKIQEFGMEVMGGFIVGFDSDTDKIFAIQKQFIQKTGIPKAMVGLLNAIPGTRLYKRLSAENRIISDDISGSNTHHLETNFIPKMGANTLKEGYKNLLNFLYGKRLKNYFKRCNQLLDSLGKTPFFSRDVRFAEIVMLFKSLFIQTFSRYGFQYLKFLTRNIIKNRSNFAEVIRLSIEGHHFHAITRETIKVEKLSSVLEKKYKLISEKINNHSAALINNTSDKIHELAKLWQTKKTAFAKIEHKIGKIKKDFREDIINKYIKIDESLRAKFKDYKEELIKYNFFKIALEI